MSVQSFIVDVDFGVDKEKFVGASLGGEWVDLDLSSVFLHKKLI